jgi:hypothetical protein
MNSDSSMRKSTMCTSNAFAETFLPRGMHVVNDAFHLHRAFDMRGGFTST